jgi:hypothetical protein
MAEPFLELLLGRGELRERVDKAAGYHRSDILDDLDQDPVVEGEIQCCARAGYWPIRPMSGISRRAVIMQLGRSGTESSLTLRWRGMDSNYRFPVAKQMELVRKPEPSRRRQKCASKRKLIFQVPMVRIHLPPAESHANPIFG